MRKSDATGGREAHRIAPLVYRACRFTERAGLDRQLSKQQHERKEKEKEANVAMQAAINRAEKELTSCSIIQVCNDG
eukprot:g27359.t1